MITQTIFRPTLVASPDGWTEIPTSTGVHQPPNRTLPAPIFDDGTAYSPHNGATGNWTIQKTVVSDVAGPGFLTIPAGSFPSSGGVYADDVVAAIRLNGVSVPFTGSGGNWPAQSVPVTWLAGNNTVEIEVANTIAGNTSLTGQLIAMGAGVPCDCCPTGPPAYAPIGVQFSGVSETAAQAGWNQVDLPATIDGTTATTALSGYNSPAGVGPSTTLQVTYTNGTGQNRVRGLRLWNQGGGDLNDADGLGPFTADFYAGATLLATLLCAGGNGATPFTFLLPPGTELTGVTSVVLRSLGKQVGGTVAPLWRELQQLQLQPVFPCRRRNGTLEWYDENGALVPSADVVLAASAAEPITLPNLHLTGSAFGDAPGGGEPLCNVVPTPSATANLTLSGACYSNAGGGSAVTMDWTSTASVELEYGQPPAFSGGVIIAFDSPPLGLITWPTNNTNMSVGEQRTSNVFGGNRRAVLTYLSGPLATAPSGTIRMEGGANIGVHRTATDNTTAPIRFRLEFFAA